MMVTALWKRMHLAMCPQIGGIATQTESRDGSAISNDIGANERRFFWKPACRCSLGKHSMVNLKTMPVQFVPVQAHVCISASWNNVTLGENAQKKVFTER